MDDRELRENLRHLPEARAGVGFTESVLARIEATGRRRRTAPATSATWRPALLAGALLVVVALASGRSDPAGTDAVTGRRPVAGAAVEAVAASGPHRGPVDSGERTLASSASPTPVAERGPTSAVAPDATAEVASTGDAGGGGASFSAPPAGTAVAAAGDPFAGAAERLARLRAERAGLEGRLAAFRRELPPAEPPVVVLGADDGLELVFDLAQWSPEWAPGGPAHGFRPAVHVPSSPLPTQPPRRF